MASEIEGQALRDYGNRKKRYRRIRMFIISMLFIAAAIAGIIYWLRLTNMTYQSYTVTNTIPNTGESTSNYISFGSAVVKYNKDGAAAINSEGDILWNGSFEMTDPIADTCGDYVVIADRGNKSIHIYNKSGEVGSIITVYNISKVEIARQGVVAAMMMDGETSYIKLFYADGSEAISSEDSSTLCEIEKSLKEDGYPMDFALSEDGKKLAVSFLSFNSGKLKSMIGFWNFGEVGKNEINNFMGGYEYEDIVIPSVTFLNNDVACAYKENGIMMFYMPEIENIIYDENYERKIKSVFHNEKYTGVVLESEEGTSAQLLLYDLKGKKVLDKKLDFEYNKIMVSGEEIVMYDNLSCIVMKTNGKVKFRYTFTSNLAAFYPVNHLNKYFLINASEISEITLQE
jgi:hypothetical protein